MKTRPRTRGLIQPEARRGYPQGPARPSLRQKAASLRAHPPAGSLAGSPQVLALSGVLILGGTPGSAARQSVTTLPGSWKLAGRGLATGGRRRGLTRTTRVWRRAGSEAVVPRFRNDGPCLSSQEAGARAASDRRPARARDPPGLSQASGPIPQAASLWGLLRPRHGHKQHPRPRVSRACRPQSVTLSRS